MNAIATLLVIGSAFLHATWNLLAKRSRDKLVFLWLANLATLPIYALPFALALRTHPVPPDGWPFIVTTGVLNSVYFATLANAYARGALSVAYPISRGTGVALVPLLAMLILGERVSAAGALGIALVIAGIVALNLQPLRALIRQTPVSHTAGRGLGTLFAFLTGLTISGYSLVDKVGVGRVFPLVYGYFLFIGVSVWLAPYMLSRRRQAIAAEWAGNRPAILAGGVLLMGAYLIVLSAMRLAQVSYIVPLREISVLIGTIMGVRLLHEGYGRERVPGAVLIVAGVLAISILG